MAANIEAVVQTRIIYIWRRDFDEMGHKKKGRQENIVHTKNRLKDVKRKCRYPIAKETKHILACFINARVRMILNNNQKHIFPEFQKSSFILIFLIRVPAVNVENKCASHRLIEEKLTCTYVSFYFKKSINQSVLTHSLHMNNPKLNDQKWIRSDISSPAF